MLEIKSPIFKKIIPNERARRATQVDMTWTCWAQPGRTLVALARVREPRSSAFNLNIPSRPHTTTTSLALVLVTHRILQIFDPSGFRLVSSRPYTVSSDLNVSSTAWAAFGCSFQRHSPRLCRTNPPPPPHRGPHAFVNACPSGPGGSSLRGAVPRHLALAFTSHRRDRFGRPLPEGEPELVVPAFVSARTLAASGPPILPHTTSDEELAAAKALLSPSRAAAHAVAASTPYVPTPPPAPFHDHVGCRLYLIPHPSFHRKPLPIVTPPIFLLFPRPCQSNRNSVRFRPRSWWFSPLRRSCSLLSSRWSMLLALYAPCLAQRWMKRPSRRHRSPSCEKPRTWSRTAWLSSRASPR